VCLSCLTRAVGGTPGRGDRIVTADVAFRDANCQDVLLVLRCEMRSLYTPEKAGPEAPIAGKDAVNTELQPGDFYKSFQQPLP